MVTSSVQTLDMKNKTEITRQPSFNPEHYLPKHHSASPMIRHTTTTHPDHTSRLEGKPNAIIGIILFLCEQIDCNRLYFSRQTERIKGGGERATHTSARTGRGVLATKC